MSEPRWLAKARTYLGTDEIKGSRHNPKIVAWHKAVSGVEHPDEVPWCAAFVGGTLKEADVSIAGVNLMARSFSKYGIAVPKTGKLPVGAIGVFSSSRGPASGHVGYIVGSDANYVSVLGGNQSDSVTIARFSRSKLIDVRWPAGEHASLAAAGYAGAAGGAVNPSDA